MFYLPYRLFDSCLQFYLKNNNPKKPLYFSILSLLFHISFIHPISLPSSFGISPRSFLCLSHFATFIPHVFNCLSPPHSTFCPFFPLFPSTTWFLSPGSHIYTHHQFFLSLALSLPKYSGISSYTSHTPCCIWIL
jgi:hypothetical protein